MKHTHTRITSQVVLALATLSSLAWAAEDAPASSDAARSEKIVVTGSRIARIDKEGPTSVTVLTAKEIEQQGYKSVFDALNNLTQNTGFVQGDDYGNTFTPAANAVSLRGLGPNHTLVLLNGHRLSDYPIAYQGTVNFVNLSDIPAGLVDRVEVLNGGASAIYGSDAIAGVINIILKKRVTGLDISARTGSLQDGGGRDTKVALSGGLNADHLSVVYAFDVNRRAMLWSKDRAFMADTTLDGSDPYSTLKRVDLNKGVNYGLDAVCGAFSRTFDGSVQTIQDGEGGSYCGTGKLRPTYWTLQTQKQGVSGFTGVTYELDPDHTVFAELQLGRNVTENNTSTVSWVSSAPNKRYFLNQNTGKIEQWAKQFSPEEIGGAERWNRRWADTSLNVALGSRGRLGQSGWHYDAVYAASGYDSRARTPRFLTGLDEFFLGPKLGTTSGGVSIYAPDPKQFYTPVTTTQFDALTGQSEARNKSWNQTASLSATGELLNLPAGPLTLATVGELGQQGYVNAADPRLAQGVFYNNSKSNYVSGARTRYALGAEFNIPILSQLTGTLAGRYDRYAFADTRIGKFTSNGGLEYRPSSSLLLRANYATSFRAPDMNYTFASQVNGYYASTTDYYRCELAGQPLSKCKFANYSPGANYTQTKNKDLQPENGQSWGLGVVWAPNSKLDVSLDYWKIQINDEVTNLDAGQLLHQEAQCRNGQLSATSTQCQDIFRRIVRNPADATFQPNVITNIFVNPINAADEVTSGIDLHANYRWRTEELGRFATQVRYSRVLTHTYRQFAGDDAQDLLHAEGATDWPSRLTTTLTWSNQAWRAALAGNLYGRISNAAGKRSLPATWLFNGSAGYEISKRASVSVTVNNLFNITKRDDSAGWPFYPVGNFTPYGRQISVGGEYHFN
ncbi:TonB-dependent receptor [Burkholderiaceae bacterium DAT-1]|nr:TonB-dependent receptor [Burkholderiaceae bacterium DAT-1]